MSHLQIDLQDGFDHDHVVVKIDGETIADQADVSTRTQIGLASSIQHEVSPGKVQIEVAVESKDLHWRREIDTTKPLYVGLSLTKDDRIVERESPAPFGYM